MVKFQTSVAAQRPAVRGSFFSCNRFHILKIHCMTPWISHFALTHAFEDPYISLPSRIGAMEPDIYTQTVLPKRTSWATFEARSAPVNRHIAFLIDYSLCVRCARPCSDLARVVLTQWRLKKRISVLKFMFISHVRFGWTVYVCHIFTWLHHWSLEPDRKCFRGSQGGVGVGFPGESP